jgi:hypothetical protein
MFDDLFGYWEEEGHEENENEGSFSEYAVVIKSIEGKQREDVFLTVWAAGFEEALTCGEILSAVYCA